MTVESAEDRAGFFTDSEFAEAATYTGPEDGALPTACTIVFDRGQAKNRWKSGDIAATSSERKAWINGDDITPAREGVLEVGAETLQIVGSPIRDETGNLWSVDLVIVV